jgi:OFA family oxalate/formate antiporter-like MFS transporter
MHIANQIAPTFDPIPPRTMSSTAAAPARENTGLHHARWWQLALGVVCMTMIANLQYGWTLFVTPIDEKYRWGRAAIQVAFTVFVLVETWLVPVEGYLVDRFGPRIVVVGAGVLVAASWVINAYADTLALLYTGAVVGGIGAGAVYGTCVGNALKWFPDRRGLAAGLTAMGFGAGSALTVFPIAAMLKAEGYEATFFWFGIMQGAVVFALGWLLRSPGADFRAPAPKARAVTQAKRDYTPLEMARTPVFWLLYLMFVMMAVGGLVATAQLTPIANDFGISDVPVSLFGLTFPALTFALSLDRVLNGVSRPFFGWVSDRIGRETTMGIAFALEGASILLLNAFGRDPTAFVLLTALVYFAWGEIYSLFPATCGDTFGRKFAAANAGLLYTAKGTASLAVPYASKIATTAEGWHTVFLLAAVMNLVAAALAVLVLKPLRARMAGAADGSAAPVPRPRAAEETAVS